MGRNRGLSPIVFLLLLLLIAEFGLAGDFAGLLTEN